MEQLFIIKSSELKLIIKDVISEKMTSLFREYAKEPKALTRDEAAERLGVNPQTISIWIKQGRLKNRSTGRKILLFDCDIDGLKCTPRIKHNKTW